MTSRLKTSSSLVAFALAWPGIAGAQSAPPPAPEVDTVVVTASRSGDATPLELLGGSASVIGDAALTDRQTRVVSDVLRDVPGAAVSRTGAQGGFTQVRLRGAEANHTLVLIDGIEASDPYFGEFDFGPLLADEGARIEVLRGQQSSLYGSDAIGGVIQYTTLSGAEAPGVRARLEGGSEGTVNGAARAAGVRGDLDYALSTSFVHTEGYPVAEGGSRDVGADGVAVSGKATWSPRPDLHLTAVGRYSRTEADSTDTDADSTSPTFGRAVDSPGDRYVNTGWYGLLRGRLDSLGGRWTNALTGQVADTTRTGYDVADAYSPRAGQPIVKASGDHGRRLKGSYESALRFGEGRVKQTATLAVDAERESENTTVSLFGAYLGERSTTNVGIVGQYELTFDDRGMFGASVRRDLNDRFADSTTYRVQGSWRFDTGTRAHAAAGSGVKAPSFSELFDYFEGRYIGNPDLKPETSEGWEAGVEQGWWARRLTLDATWFSNRLRDEITTTYTEAGAMPINLPGRTRQEGVEVSGAARLAGGWRLDGAYTWLHAPQQRFVIAGGDFGEVKAQAARRPEHVASANLTYAPDGRPYAATLTVRYTGTQSDLAYVDPSYVPLLVKLKTFTLVNLNARWRLNERLELYGRIENLLDRSYEEVFSFAGQGRTAYGGVRLTL